MYLILYATKIRAGNCTTIANKQVPPIKENAFIIFLYTTPIPVVEMTKIDVIAKCSNVFVFLWIPIKQKTYCLKGTHVSTSEVSTLNCIPNLPTSIR